MNELTFLREMLEIYSPSGKEGEMAAYLLTQMRALGFRTYQDPAGNAIGVLGEGKREIVLLGHMDTVEGFIPIRLQDDRLYGRGGGRQGAAGHLHLGSGASGAPARQAHRGGGRRRGGDDL